MAVQIPVYIDIMGAVNEAVKSVPKAVSQIQSAVSERTLNLEFNVGGGARMKLQEMLFGDVSPRLLRKSLAGIKDEFNQVSAAARANAKSDPGLKKTKELANAYGLVAQRLRGVSGQAESTGLIMEHYINKVKDKIAQLQQKQVGLSKSSSEWQKINYQIQIQEQKLRQLNTQQEIYKIKSKQATSGATAGFSATNNAMSLQAGLLGRLTTMMGYYVSIFGLIRFVKQLRDVTGQLEYQRVALGRLIQDEEYGAQLFERIKKAAVESPFRIKDLVTYTKQLAAYRVEQEDLFDVMHRLADVSAGLGVDMNRLILAYGQVKAASVLRGQELRQFTEAGIPLVELLAEKFTDLRGELVSTSEVFKLISARAVPFSMISDIFEEMTDAGGMFYKMQEKQAQTLQGRWEKLKDTYDIALQSIGDTESFRKANDRVLWSLNLLARNLALIPKLLRGITVGYLSFITISKAVKLWNDRHIIQEKIIAAQLLRRKNQSAGVTKAEIARMIQSNLLAKAEARLAVASNAASKALYKMLIAMINNPVTALIAGITALAAAIFSFSKKADEASDSVVNLDKTIDEFNKTLKETKKVDALIDSYEKLGKKTDRSEKESARLENTIRRLQVLFPELSLSVDDDTKKIEGNTEAMRKNNEERLKQAKDRAETDIFVAEENLKRYKDEREIALAQYKAVAANAKRINTSGFWSLLFGSQAEKDLKEANKWLDKLNELDEKIISTEKDVARLNEMMNPKEEAIKGWKQLLGTLQFSKGGAQLFSPEQFEGWTRLYDVSNDLEKEWKKLKEDMEGIRNAMPKPGDDNYDEWLKDLNIAKDRYEGLVVIMKIFGFIWGRQTNGTYHKDAFITLMENRIKFMKDFKKGYDDLSKSLTKDRALQKEFGFMQGRGLNLGLGKEEQKSAAEGLSDWYTNQIKAVMAEMRKKGLKGNTVTEFLSQQIKGEGNKQKLLRDYQALLQFLWDAKTDFDTSEAEKNIERALKRIEDNLKRSETVNNFYRDILDLTGDKDLAQNLTLSVYGEGNIGKGFKDRIQQEMTDALSDKDLWEGNIDEDLKKELMELVSVFDVDEIRKNLGKLPPKIKELFEKTLQSNEQFNANWYKDFIKTFKKAKTYEERVNILQGQRKQKLDEARERKASQSDIDAIDAYYDKQIAEVQLEAMKDTYTWTKAFEDLDGVSSTTLNNLIDLIDTYVRKYGKDLEPNQLKELTRARESAEAQRLKRNAYAGVIKSLEGLSYYTVRANAFEKQGLTTDEEYIKLQDAKQKALKELSDSLDMVNSDMNALVESTSHLVNTFASEKSASYFSEQMGNISSSFSAFSKAATGIASIAAGVINPQTIMQAATGIADLVASIFDIGNASKIRRAEQAIEQQQRLLDELEHTYSRLESAEEKAFGSDYITSYNQRLKVILAEQKAYQAQADAERTKGKKADEDKIRDYENSARDAAERLADMQSEVSEKFLGTDLGSAARDFASAWVDAYKEFGSTTDAMSEKFSDMIQNMIVESMAAKIVQGQLAPIFDMIDTLANDDNQFSVMDAAMVASKTKETIGALNTGLTNLMNALGGAGINIRQMGTGLTGIAKDIQGASEESILGLAAGVNTQNYYMAHIDVNVAAILAALTGASASSAGAGNVSASDPYRDQMLAYVGSLPQMRDDMASIRTMLERVIHPNGTPSLYYVSAKM